MRDLPGEQQRGHPQRCGEVAAALGARHHLLDVQPMLAAYRAAIEGALGRELTWEEDDLTLQNLERRAQSIDLGAGNGRTRC